MPNERRPYDYAMIVAEPGERMDMYGQDYTLLRLIPHVRTDGQVSKIVEWEANCRSCGQPFTFMTAMKFRSPAKRCKACRIHPEGYEPAMADKIPTDPATIGDKTHPENTPHLERLTCTGFETL